MNLSSTPAATCKRAFERSFTTDSLVSSDEMDFSSSLKSRTQGDKGSGIYLIIKCTYTENKAWFSCETEFYQTKLFHAHVKDITMILYDNPSKKKKTIHVLPFFFLTLQL